ncbi:MAG: glycoside hydrolase family 28 protein [Candidatus Glassbacteria bacterium]|nr:glycoside hydrolase family 28 protein [Candidatus Glassbacteria bacterium]
MRVSKTVLTAFSAAMCLAACTLAAAGVPPGTLYNVRDYGAAGDGEARDTPAIQQAVDAASSAGGGTVYFPPGKYLSGTIFLKSLATLHLETGATLLGSTDISDFPQTRPKFRSYTDKYVSQSLIYAEGQHDIAITGSGTIDGQGQAFQWKEYGNRPDVIRMVSCTHVHLEGIRLQNSPMWMQHYLDCEFITVRGIHVFNHSTYNNDMIDIDCCRNVRISDCYGNSDDDALTLKSTADRPTENVVVTNCVLGSGCNAIKMGTESNGGFKNISITNCVIDSWYGKKGFYALPRGIGGIVLEIVDGGTMENITISNIDIRNVHVPLFLRLGNRARPFKQDMEKPGMGSYRNVVISNIIATGLDKAGCSITGLPGHPIRGVTLSNLRLTFPGGGTAEDYRRAVPELEDQYPEAVMFGTLPAWALYCRHVEGLRLENLDLVLEGADSRPALVFDDVRGLDLDGLTEKRQDSPSAPLMVLRDVAGAGFRACRPVDSTPVFLLLEGAVQRIMASGNDLSGVTKPFELGPGVPVGALFQGGNLIKE